jgi:hypothetical protein
LLRVQKIGAFDILIDLETRSHNRPQRERLPCFKTGISVVNKVELADVIGTGESETAKERCLRYPLIPTSMNRAVASILSTYASGLGTHTP